MRTPTIPEAAWKQQQAFIDGIEESEERDRWNQQMQAARTFVHQFDAQAPEGNEREFCLWFRHLARSFWNGDAPAWLRALLTEDAPTNGQAKRWSSAYTPAQVDRMEELAGITFPPSYRTFLETLGEVTARDFKGSIDWTERVPRNYRMSNLDELLWATWVSHHWNPAWGPYPQCFEECLSRVQATLWNATEVLPLCCREVVLLDERAGYPVFFMRGTDTFVYAHSLRHYLLKEFLLPHSRASWLPLVDTESVRHVSFWSELKSTYQYLTQEELQAWFENDMVTDQRKAQLRAWYESVGKRC